MNERIRTVEKVKKRRFYFFFQLCCTVGFGVALNHSEYHAAQQELSTLNPQLSFLTWLSFTMFIVEMLASLWTRYYITVETIRIHRIKTVIIQLINTIIGISSATYLYDLPDEFRTTNFRLWTTLEALTWWRMLPILFVGLFCMCFTCWGCCAVCVLGTQHRQRAV